VDLKRELNEINKVADYRINLTDIDKNMKTYVIEECSKCMKAAALRMHIAK
jgi:hypothetical protein